MRLSAKHDLPGKESNVLKDDSLIPLKTDSGPSLRTWLLVAILFVNFASRLIILLRPLIYLDNLAIHSFFTYSMISDDAYLCLKIARNIALGLGPTFDGISFTNGFQPLYVFLLVPLFRLFPNDLITPVHVSLLISSIFGTLSLYLMLKLSSRFTRSLGVPVLLSLLWVFNPYVISTTLNGMETMMAFFFVLLFLHYFDSKRPLTGDRSTFALGVILGLAMLVRLDAIFLGISLFLVMTFKLLKGRLLFGRYVKTLLMTALGVLLAYSPWMVYSYVHSGKIFPVSGKAIRLITLSTVNDAPTIGNLYLPMLLKGLKALWFGNAFLIVLLCLVMLGYALMFGFSRLHMKLVIERFKRHSLLLVYGIILFLTYILYFFAPYYFPRYLFPEILIFLFGLSVMIDLWLAAKVKSKYKMVFVFPVLASLVLMLVAGGFPKFFVSKDVNCCGYMNIGIWAGANLEPGSKVGSCQSGALGYFAENLKVINLDGVVNNPCYQALRKKRATEYIKSQKIDYVLGWVINFDFLSNYSTNYQKSDFALVGIIPGYKSWDKEWFVTLVNYGQLDTLLHSGNPSE